MPTKVDEFTYELHALEHYGDWGIRLAARRGWDEGCDVRVADVRPSVGDMRHSNYVVVTYEVWQATEVDTGEDLAEALRDVAAAIGRLATALEARTA